MQRILRILLFVASASSMWAGPITYSAIVGCNATCVTVSLSWANLPFPITDAEVDDNLGQTLFNLNVPFPPVTTGSIVPNPQTVFGLSDSTVQLITNGQPLFAATALGFGASALDGDCQPTYANVVLGNDALGVSIIERFVATEQSSTVPEPAALSLVGFGLLAVLARARSRRLKGQR